MKVEGFPPAQRGRGVVVANEPAVKTGWSRAWGGEAAVDRPSRMLFHL